MACVYTAVRLTIVSTGSKFQPLLNFTELHAHTQAVHSYVLSGMSTLELSSGETTNTTTVNVLPVPPSSACEQSRLVGCSGGTIAQEIIHGGPAFEYT